MEGGYVDFIRQDYMKRLTRKARVLLFAVIILMLICTSLFFILPKENKIEHKAQYSIKVVAQDQKLISTYMNTISKDQSSNDYQSCKIEVKKGTKVQGYTLSDNQTFTKYIQLLGPDGEEKTNKSNQLLTHYAYSLLLVGDIVEKTNLETKEKTYMIDNARITYNQIPIVLLSNENSVSVINEKNTKEKVVNLQDFKDALNDVSKRDTMISW